MQYAAGIIIHPNPTMALPVVEIFALYISQTSTEHRPTTVCTVCMILYRYNLIQTGAEVKTKTKVEQTDADSLRTSQIAAKYTKNLPVCR